MAENTPQQPERDLERDRAQPSESGTPGAWVEPEQPEERVAPPRPQPPPTDRAAPPKPPASTPPVDQSAATPPAGPPIAKPAEQVAPKDLRPYKVPWWAKIGVAAAVIVAGWFMFFGPSQPIPDGPSHPNYAKHVHSVATEIALGSADVDLELTAAVKRDIEQGKASKAVASLSAGMKAEIMTGDAKFFHIYLYDNCAEDGDIVSVQVNGAPFAQVPITHAGTTISVPLSTKAPNALTITGVHDGGGGITVACQTSNGTYYSKVMGVGETQPLAVATVH